MKKNSIIISFKCSQFSKVHLMPLGRWRLFILYFFRILITCHARPFSLPIIFDIKTFDFYFSFLIDTCQCLDETTLRAQRLQSNSTFDFCIIYVIKLYLHIKSSVAYIFLCMRPTSNKCSLRRLVF